MSKSHKPEEGGRKRTTMKGAVYLSAGHRATVNLRHITTITFIHSFAT